MCGGIAGLARHLLQEAGELVRTGLFWPNGHVVIEFFAPDLQKWIMVDIHNHAIPQQGDRFLSVAEVIAAQGQFDVHRLSRLGAIDCFSWDQTVTGEFPPESEALIYDDDLLRKYYSPPVRIGLGDEKNMFWFGRRAGDSDDNAELATNRRLVSADEWQAKFYS